MANPPYAVGPNAFDDANAAGDTVPSIIPTRRPKKPGMPKLQLPSRPSSSSSLSNAPGPAAGGSGLRFPTPPLGNLAHASTSQPSLNLAIPAAHSFSNLNPNSHSNEDEFDGTMGNTFAADPTTMTTATATTTTHNSIYPDTVGSGLQDPHAMTNDLRRAIGRLSIEENDGSKRNSLNGTGSSSGISQPTPHGPSTTTKDGHGTGADQQITARSSFSDTAQSTPLSESALTSATDETSIRSSASQELEEESEYKLQGNMEPLERLGEGASGEVRKARYKPTGQVMAMKTISTSPNPAIHRQILRELSFNRTCRSEYIVRCYGAFLANEDTSIVICMEQCEAGSLDGIYKRVKARNGRMGEKILAKIAESGLKGLAYLHTRKIIHRDIKPSNMLVTRDGQIKLCDFGVSGELIDSMAGTFTGTSFYMAPERIKGLPYTITSDVWSLGLTILELASNRFPFPPEGEPPLGPIDLLSYVVTMKVPELKDDVNTGIKWTKAFRDFLEHCLEKDGNKRYGPVKMLNHPWMKKAIARVPQPDVAKFVAEVWGWPVPLCAVSAPILSPSSAIAPAPQQPRTIVAENIEVPHLGRVASLRKAPSPIMPLSATSSAKGSPHSGIPGFEQSVTSVSKASSSSMSPSSRRRHVGLSILEERGGVNADGLDADGRTALERAEARQREADVGLIGSPTEPDDEEEGAL